MRPLAWDGFRPAMYLFQAVAAHNTLLHVFPSMQQSSLDEEYFNTGVSVEKPFALSSCFMIRPQM